MGVLKANKSNIQAGINFREKASNPYGDLISGGEIKIPNRLSKKQYSYIAN
jgi:hypothetical protein